MSLALMTMLNFPVHAQTVIITNYTFDTSASATPPAWGVWVNGTGQYVGNGWNSSDVSNSLSSGSLVVTSTFTGASQQSVIWNGAGGGYNPPLNGSLITNFSCYVRFDPTSPTNSSTSSYGSLAFYLNTADNGTATQIGTYFHPPAGNTNWVLYSMPVSISQNIYAITIQLETFGNALTGTAKMYVDDAELTGGTMASNTPINGTSTVDWNNVHQRIDGFGASSAWNSSWTTAEADLLFSTNMNVSYQSGTYNGVGLSLLRNHMYYANTTAATDSDSTTENTIMQLAQARGARVWSTPWTPAVGFKSTTDTYDNNQATDNGIDGGSYLGSGNNITNINYASQLANYVANMKNTYGVNIYALSIQNEPDANVTTYEACQWTGAQVHDFVTNLYSALAAQGLTSTKIIIPESENWSADTALYTPTLNDSAVAADVSIIANHDYVTDNGAGDQTTPVALSVSGKALWETEVALLSGSDSSINNGVYYAQRIYQYMTQANANAYHYWWLVASGSGNEGLLDTSAAVTKRLFTFGQYSRFVRPNYYRINATSSRASVLVSAYKDSVSPRFAIVVVNTNAATGVLETFSLANFTAGSVTPWVTTSTQSLAPQTPVIVTNASVTYFVPAMSVVTLVGQGNTPPVINAVPNQTINVGATLLVTNIASDSDVPAQVLTFNPANALPANATINGASGVFSWRPHVSQANTTNLIQIQVTDNGSPNLSATNAFNVIVNPVTNPVVGGVTFAPGQISMTVNGPQGPDYTFLTSSNLTTWQPLFTTNSPTLPFTMVYTNLNNPFLFYRFQIGP